LVAAVRAGDDHAFEQLYHRYQRRIGAYIYGMVHDHGRAEDITQDVFMSALRRMRATETPIAFKPWVYEIAKNACIDAFRRSKRAEEISYDADDGSDRLHLVSKGPTPEAAVDTRMSLDHLRGAFGGLSEAHHQILVMRELEGLSYRQIGERLGMSRPSVESTLFRARRRLSEEYEELVSGERCRRIQSIITGASDGRVGARDERKMARHVSYCQPCRRAAFAAGFDADALTPKRTVREKIAALLPLPAFLKRRIAGHGAAADENAAASVGGHAATLAQLSTAAAAVGAGVVAHDTGLIGGAPRDERPAAISSPATPSRDAAGSLTTRPAANGTSAGGAGASSSSSTPSSGGSSSGSGSNGGAGSSSGSQSPSTPLGNDPLNSVTSKLPSTGDDPVTKTVKHLTNPGSRDVPIKTPEVPKVEVPKVELPKLPDPPASVPDPGGVVSGATGAVNGATGTVTGAVNGATGTAGGVVGGATGTAGGVVGGATGTAGGVVGGATGTAGGVAGGATGTATGTVGGVTGGGGLPGGG
jgi:RNA polymerase sigma factor (sigma-70 family)